MAEDGKVLAQDDIDALFNQDGESQEPEEPPDWGGNEGAWGY